MLLVLVGVVSHENGLGSEPTLIHINDPIAIILEVAYSLLHPLAPSLIFPFLLSH